MKKMLLLSAMLASGCASTATRQISSAQPAGQKFTCTKYKAGGGAPVFHVWVDGDQAALLRGNESKPERYAIEVDSSNDPGKPYSAGRASYYLYARIAKESPANYDSGSIEVDLRMRDGSWAKNVISNSAGHTVFPSLHFAIREGHSAQSDDYDNDIDSYDCDPNDQVPTY